MQYHEFKFRVRKFDISGLKKLARWLLPTPGNVIFTALVLITVFWADVVQALPWSPQAVPPGLSTGTWPYQGRLADSAGNPITDTLPMTFRIYSANSGGDMLWEERWEGASNVQVSDGLFNVMLGSLNPIPQNVVTGHSSLWLGIEVDNDTEMTPRVQLGSVPFAAQALTVPDGSIDSSKLASAAVTNDKIFDNSVSEQKIANGAVSKSKLGADVQIPQIQSGELMGSYTDPGWTLATTPGDRYTTYHVTFSTPFSEPPSVIVSIKYFDIVNSSPSKVLETYASNISSSGFDVVFHTYGDVQVNGAAVSWIAYR